ncbi:hypothetical protein [Salinimicrobium xinjiangense]|uniref:hypothetical protein n=1 Tax=Salinimicrobium xinjiangense TaxID=438596 RepID=UPI0006861447|nr:hypothetical protein [Salinimicrobium xinjiangense]
MEKIWIIAVLVFIIISFLFWRITRGHFQKEYGQKVWKQWATRFFYWQGVVFVGTGGTLFVLFLLKWSNILSF